MPFSEKNVEKGKQLLAWLQARPRIYMLLFKLINIVGWLAGLVLWPLRKLFG